MIEVVSKHVKQQLQLWEINKLASLEATLVGNSADRLTESIGVKCRAICVAKDLELTKYPPSEWVVRVNL